MEKRLKNYLLYIEALLSGEPLKKSEKKQLRKDMLIQIGFFQHERLIHLIVTVTFALLAVITLLASLFFKMIALYILTGLLIILLVPYVRHYYILENGVQKLYEAYDKII